MKLINKTRRCSSCGCLSFPDSRICPKCGKSYIATGLVNKPEPLLESLGFYRPGLKDITALNQSIIINIRDNITISIADNQFIQIN